VLGRERVFCAGISALLYSNDHYVKTLLNVNQKIKLNDHKENENNRHLL
jgi:hypothetical protein